MPRTSANTMAVRMLRRLLSRAAICFEGLGRDRIACLGGKGHASLCKLTIGFKSWLGFETGTGAGTAFFRLRRDCTLTLTGCCVCTGDCTVACPLKSSRPASFLAAAFRFSIIEETMDHTTLKIMINVTPFIPSSIEESLVCYGCTRWRFPASSVAQAKSTPNTSPSELGVNTAFVCPARTN